MITRTGILESQTELSINMTDITEAMSAIPITESTNMHYKDIMYQGDSKGLIYKDRLCFVSLNRIVPKEILEEFQQIVAKSWIMINPSKQQVNVPLIVCMLCYRHV